MSKRDKFLWVRFSEIKEKYIKLNEYSEKRGQPVVEDEIKSKIDMMIRDIATDKKKIAKYFKPLPKGDMGDYSICPLTEAAEMLVHMSDLHKHIIK